MPMLWDVERDSIRIVEWGSGVQERADLGECGAFLRSFGGIWSGFGV